MTCHQTGYWLVAPPHFVSNSSSSSCSSQIHCHLHFGQIHGLRLHLPVLVESKVQSDPFANIWLSLIRNKVWQRSVLGHCRLLSHCSLSCCCTIRWGPPPFKEVTEVLYANLLMAHHLITGPDVSHGQNGPKRSDLGQMKRANGTRQAKNKNRKTASFS